MANPFAIDIGNPLAGFGQMAQAWGQNRQREGQQQAQTQSREAAFKLLGESQQAEDPEQRKQLFMEAYAADPEMIKGWTETMKKQREGEQVGTQEVKTSSEMVAFNDLIKGFTPKEQELARKVKAGLKGRAVTNAELTAIQSGEIKDYSEWKTRMKQQEKFAEMTGSSRAKAIDQGFETIAKIDGAVRNYDRAIAAIKAGAGVGVLEKFWPSIKAASVELDNIRGSMALDVVGATTFGALSKGELDLAKDVALPTGLDSEELIDYLERKKVAQGKLREYYNEQIQFLDQGGTIAGFMRSKEKENSAKQPQTQGEAPQGAIDYLKANPQAAEQFKAKFGYLPEGL